MASVFACLFFIIPFFLENFSKVVFSYLFCLVFEFIQIEWFLGQVLDHKYTFYILIHFYFPI